MRPTTDPTHLIVSTDDNPVDVMLELVRRAGFEIDPDKLPMIQELRDYCEQRI